MIGVWVILGMAVLVALVLYAVPRWPQRRGKAPAKPDHKSDLMWQYIVALLATVVGVYLALFLNRVDVQRAEERAARERETAERQRVAGLLRKAEDELSELKQDLRTVYWMDARGTRSALRYSPIETPRVVEAVISTEVVLRLMSEDGYASIRGLLSQTAALARWLNDPSNDGASFRENLDVLGMTLGMLHHWIGAERRYVLGEWTDGERNAYGNRWMMYELAGDSTKSTWAQLRSVPVAVRTGALHTPIGGEHAVDLLYDSLPPPAIGRNK